MMVFNQRCESQLLHGSLDTQQVFDFYICFEINGSIASVQYSDWH